MIIANFFVLLFLLPFVYLAERFAICINGNVKRLELGSKIRNLLLPNLMKGYDIDVFVYLEPAHVQSHHIVKYHHAIYTNNTETELQNIILQGVQDEFALFNVSSQSIMKPGIFHVYVKMPPPSQKRYAIVGEKVPMVLSYYGRNASMQFQIAFRQFNALRQCAIWMEDQEIIERIHFDFFVRLREDTYVLKPFLFNPTAWKDYLVFSEYATYNGVCDRWFILDRKFVNGFVRGLVEHYYLDTSRVGEVWQGTESLLYHCWKSLGVSAITLSVCDLAMITIRNVKNESYWVVDQSSVSEFLVHNSKEEWYQGNLTCLKENGWDNIFEDQAVRLMDFDMNRLRSIYPE